MKKYLLISAIISFIIASIIIYIAIDHNPMETYCKNQTNGECIPNLKNITGLWLSWFIPSFAIIAIIILVISKAINMLKTKALIG